MNEKTYEELKKIIEDLCSEMSLVFVKLSEHYDELLENNVVEVLIDTETFDITLDKIEEFNEKLGERIDSLEGLPSSYILDVSSGGSEREIPFSYLPNLIDKYVDIKIKGLDRVQAKLISYEDKKLKLAYYIKGKPKKITCDEEEVESIKMAYKA